MSIDFGRYDPSATTGYNDRENLLDNDEHTYQLETEITKNDSKTKNFVKILKPKKSHLKLLVIAILAISARFLTPVVLDRQNGSGIPAYSPPPLTTPFAARIADSMIFKANAIAKLLGEPDEGSEMAKVAKNWAVHIEHDRQYIGAEDIDSGLVILNFMNLYLRMKVVGGLEKQIFFLKVFRILGFRNGESFVEGSRPADWEEERFWRMARTELSEPNDPKTPQNQKFADLGQSEYWSNSWSPLAAEGPRGTQKDARKVIAAKLFNTKAEKTAFDFETLSTSAGSTPLRYLASFESARLSSQLDTDDRQFVHGVEIAIKCWADSPNCSKLQRLKHLLNL